MHIDWHDNLKAMTPVAKLKNAKCNIYIVVSSLNLESMHVATILADHATRSSNPKHSVCDMPSHIFSNHTLYRPIL